MELQMIVLNAIATAIAAVVALFTYTALKSKNIKSDAERLKTLETSVDYIKLDIDGKIAGVKNSLFDKIEVVREALERHGDDELRQWDQVNQMNSTITSLISELTAQRGMQTGMRNDVGKISNAVDRFARVYSDVSHMKEDITSIKKKLNM